MKIPENPPVLKLELIDPAVSKDSESIELSREYNKRYLHWDELRYRECGKYGPYNLWYLMKISRDLTSRRIKISGLELSYNIPDDCMRSLHEMDMSLSTGFTPTEKMEEKRKLMYAVSSIMEESIASSQLEGASTTTKAAKRMLRNNSTPKDRSQQMILNNYNAMRLIRSKMDEPMTIDLIREIHAVISHDTLDDPSFEGVFRSDDSIVVGDKLTGAVYHQPVPYGDIEPMLLELCSFANGSEPFVHPIVKGILIHFILAYIHPFVDGNGRVARLLFYWFAMKSGYGLMEYLSISKVIKKRRGKYDLAYLMSETDSNDVTYFIGYNLEVIEESIDIFSDYLDRKMDEQDEALENIRMYGLTTRQEDVLAEMIHSGEPVTAYELATMFGTDVQNIRKDLIVLIGKGLVDVHGKDGRKKTYIYKGRR